MHIFVVAILHQVKVKARLSNPLPKTQAVKGGMRGGFRIRHSAVGFGKFYSSTKPLLFGFLVFFGLAQFWVVFYTIGCY